MYRELNTVSECRRYEAAVFAFCRTAWRFSDSPLTFAWVVRTSSKTESRKAGIIWSAILTGFLLVLAILAIVGKTAYPAGTPQNRYWTDYIVDFLASYKEAVVIVLAVLFGVYRYVQIPQGRFSKIWTGVWAVLIPGLLTTKGVLRSTEMQS